MNTSLHKLSEKTLDVLASPLASLLITLLVTLLPVLVMVLAANTAAEAPTDNRGYEIAARSDRSDRGFGHSTVQLQMILRNAAGQEATRTLWLNTLEITDESVGDKRMIIY